MVRCAELCPEGYFGPDCYRACRCRNENYVCHPTLGCVCQPTLHGPNCSTAIWQENPAATQPTLGEHQEGGAGTAVGIILTILILSLTITVTVYYRKRFYSLKTQMSHVHYSASSHNNHGQPRPASQ